MFQMLISHSQTFENFLIAAFAMHIGVMSKGVSIVFAWMEDDFFFPFKGYIFMGYDHEFELYICIQTLYKHTQYI